MLPICFLAKCNFGDGRAILFINRNHAFLILAMKIGRSRSLPPTPHHLKTNLSLINIMQTQLLASVSVHTWFLSEEKEEFPQGKAKFLMKQHVGTAGSTTRNSVGLQPYVSIYLGDRGPVRKIQQAHYSQEGSCGHRENLCDSVEQDFTLNGKKKCTTQIALREKLPEGTQWKFISQ